MCFYFFIFKLSIFMSCQEVDFQEAAEAGADQVVSVVRDFLKAVKALDGRILSTVIVCQEVAYECNFSQDGSFSIVISSRKNFSADAE